MNNAEDEKLRETTIAFLKEFAEQGYENATQCIDWLERQTEKHVECSLEEETNAPIGYGKYVDECLNEAAKHFFSEGEDKYSVADLFYAGVKCGTSWLEKQGESDETKTK